MILAVFHARFEAESAYADDLWNANRGSDCDCTDLHRMELDFMELLVDDFDNGESILNGAD